MQIVIDIPEEDYESMKWTSVKNGVTNSYYYLRELILNGTPLPKCKDCKHFEYDSVANVDGIPLIVAHEICNRWGDGCKTREDGYCFLFETDKEQT